MKNFMPNIGNDYGGRLMAAWLDRQRAGERAPCECTCQGVAVRPLDQRNAVGATVEPVKPRSLSGCITNANS